MNKIVVLGTATIFFVYGLLFIVIPMETFEFVVDGTVNSSSGITDIRATYGGMSVGVGLVIFMLGMNQQTLKQGLVAVFILMIGMATGRSLGIYLDGNTNAFMYIYLALELAVSFVALVLFKTSNES